MRAQLVGTIVMGLLVIGMIEATTGELLPTGEPVDEISANATENLNRQMERTHGARQNEVDWRIHHKYQKLCWSGCFRYGPCHYCRQLMDGTGSCCRKGRTKGEGCTGFNGCNGDPCCVYPEKKIDPADGWPGATSYFCDDTREYSPRKAFYWSRSDYWHNEFRTELPQTLFFKSNKKVRVTAFKLFGGRDERYYPKNFTFFGSNGESCLTEDKWEYKREFQDVHYSGKKKNLFEATTNDIKQEFRCYGIKVKNANYRSSTGEYTAVHRLELFARETPALKPTSDPNSCSEDENAKLIHYDGNPHTNTAYSSSFGAANAFRQEYGVGEPYMSKTLPALVWYKFNNDVCISKISMMTQRPCPRGRQGCSWRSMCKAPASLKVLGSNDCSSWVVLKSVENTGFTGLNQMKSWEFNKKRYSCIGVRFLTVKGNCAEVAIHNIQMYG